MSFQPIHPDPFNVPSQSPPHPAGSPPLTNVYHAPLSDPYAPPIHAVSPPPMDYMNAGYSNSLQATSPTLHSLTPPPHSMLASPQPTSYLGGQSFTDLNDEQDQDISDTGDMPLLQRRGGGQRTPPISMPGEFDPPTSDNQSENNIRYGRIPQRVPRRYKTIKKVE